MKLIKSVCPYCGTGCGIIMETNGKSVRVLPQKDHPVSKGELCIKGLTIGDVINSPMRLKTPLVRKDGKLQPASWEEALSFVAKEFSRIKETYEDALGVFASTKCTNEENYLIQKFSRVVLGTNNIDNSARLCHAPTMSALQEEIGKSAMSNSFEDLAQADCILIFGSNPAVTQPVGFSRIQECKKRGGKIVCIDVQKNETARLSDIFLQINPGTDLVLAAGLAKIILEQGLESKEFIAKRTKGFGEFADSLKKYSLENIAEITGVPIALMKEVALLYAKGNSALINGMGVAQKPFGAETILAIANLALLTGNLGKPGSGINPLRGCNNVQGCCDMGCLPDFYPGYAAITEENIKRFEDFWDAELPVQRGLTEVEMIDAIPEKILGVYIIGENPMLSLPNLNSAENSLGNLEFLVVQDMFLTETAQIAHVVLPAACFAEKTSTFTNTERRVQMIRKALQPKGCKSDFDIIKILAEKMDCKKFNYRTPQQVFSEIRKAVPQYSGITYKKLGSSGMQWPCNKSAPKGTKILYEKGFEKIPTFYPVSHREFRRSTGYPFYMVCARSLAHYNTGTFTRKVESLNRAELENALEINKEDAERLGLKEGEIVRVVSEYGEIMLEIRMSDNVKSGTVSTKNHFFESAVNRLTSSELDPLSKTPGYKNCFVHIEKII